MQVLTPIWFSQFSLEHIIFLNRTKFNATRLWLLVVLLMIFCSGCQQYLIEHNPGLAGETAVSFAEVAFVKQEYESALKFLPKDRDDSFTADTLKGFVAHTHTGVEFPRSVELLAYEIVPGQRAIKVFLKASSVKQNSHYYQLILSGDESSGYKVIEFYGNSQEFPTSQLRRNF
jgi:hypothetical protein